MNMILRNVSCFLVSAFAAVGSCGCCGSWCKWSESGGVILNDVKLTAYYSDDKSYADKIILYRPSGPNTVESAGVQLVETWTIVFASDGAKQYFLKMDDKTDVDVVARGLTAHDECNNQVFLLKELKTR